MLKVRLLLRSLGKSRFLGRIVSLFPAFIISRAAERLVVSSPPVCGVWAHRML